MNTSYRVALAAAMVLTTGLAHAELVVVVSAKSTVARLNRDQVADIFLGKVVTYPAGGQAQPVDQAVGSSVRDEFYTKVTGRSAAQVKAHWAKQSFSGKGTPPRAIAGDDEVRKHVAEHPDAIGYVDKSRVDASVKVVFSP